MRILVKPHTIDIQSNPVNELEINVTRCYFEFSEEITNDFVKEAYFTLGDGDTYKKIIVNDECDIPSEVLVKPGTIEVGVVAYLVEDEQTIKRYNPKPGYFTSWEGSLKEAENSQEITPSEMEQYEQALQEGLNQVENVDIDAEQTVSGATVTITNRNAVEKTVTILNGQDGEKGADGKDGIDGKDGKDGKDGINGQNGITPTIGNNGNWYLGDTDTGKPSRGIQGETGPAGADGRDGIDGQNGTNGADGYSPTATVIKSGSTATISITDKNGTTTATVSDGTNGTNGQDGQNGVGVPTGGTQGQILAKKTNTDYDTEWINAPSGGGEVKGIHSEKYATQSNNKTVKTHTYFFGEGYGTSGNFTSHGTDFLEKVYNDMAQYFDTSANENILQIFGKDNDGFYVLDIRLSSLTSSGTCYGKAVVITYNQMIRQQIKFNITLTEGVYKVSSLMNNGETMLFALTTQNATPFTPTADYHPATKKYVDDLVGNIESLLGGI